MSGKTIDGMVYQRPVIADYGDLRQLTAANALRDCEDAGGKPPFTDGSDVTNCV